MVQQNQRLGLKYQPSLRMQQGLQMLQFPLTELSSYVAQQIVHNPFFDISSLEEDTFCSYRANFCDFSHPDSFFHHLFNQACQTFSENHDLIIAQYIIGNLSDQGLFLQDPEFVALHLEVSLEKVLKIWENIQEFHPLGVAAPSLQAYWLRNLRKTEHPRAYEIIANHYTLLANCEFVKLSHKLRCSLEDLRSILKKALSSIPWSPAAGYAKGKTDLLSPLPDVYLSHDGQVWQIQINGKGLPEIKLNNEIFALYETLSHSERKCLNQYLISAKWLIKNLRKRERTLFAIVEKIILYQEQYLLGEELIPRPLSVKILSRDLAFHESTIFRAIENKALATPIGILPMKHFLPKSVSQNSCCSKDLILRWIQEWIASEKSPLSDVDISRRIATQGISCARRTVAKYREQLNILPAHKRKQRFCI
ncbi:RNA polymerase sigma-54 factor [Chlamydia ibidis]|uniref:RNA polymerase sigma-54 factor n=2 Tax=Chlamydia ibidis TaxID=1405396 RepID=S7J2S2_9CHLA|nr:RNA polymerase factor sigma-54 [Chlamydia ibidis]EPP34543.1 RNA polymerase sigma-54 factor [Chlamydia ibidis]EQM62992.1 RNA polymerase sigma-54 factor [Chlamydia ibidis 10-1398/6]